MKKELGIIGISILALLSVLKPSVNVYANDNLTQNSIAIVETQELPETLTYEDLCKLYSCKDDERIIDPAIIEFTQEDAVRLMKVAQAEAGTEDPVAMAYVMMVIVNRLNDDYWPDSIEKILTQRKQFSVYQSGRYQKTVPNANAHYALYLVESGQIDIEAEYFEAVSETNSWQSKHRKVEFEYNGHRFYK